MLVFWEKKALFWKIRAKAIPGKKVFYGISQMPDPRGQLEIQSIKSD